MKPRVAGEPPRAGTAAPSRAPDVPLESEPPTAWILAGGRSRRFGSDKALHLVSGETLLDRTARVCRETGLSVVVVARHARAGGLETLLEPGGPRHPLHGVATALAEAERRGHVHALLLPVDLPDLRVEALRLLVAAPSPAYAAGQRLLMMLPVSVAGIAADHAARGASVREFLAAIGAVSVQVGELGNLNLAPANPPPPPPKAT